MRELTDSLASGYNQKFARRGGEAPYFETSALAAYGAQTRLQNKPLEDKVTYESIKLKLGLETASDHEVLIASQIPHLVDSLTQFASDHRIEGQIRDAQKTLDSIVETLRHGYQGEESKLTQNRGDFYLQNEVNKRLERQQAALENKIRDFRGYQLARFEEWRSQLEAVAQQVCNATDRNLRSKIPAIWEEAFNDKRDIIDTKTISKPFLEFTLSEIQLELWNQLTQHVSLISEQLVRIYSEELSAYQMTHHIVGQLYECLELPKLESIVADLVETQMRRSLVQMGDRIAITAMTDPSHNFTATAEGRYVHPLLFESLNKMPQSRIIDSAACDDLVAVVRQQYEPFVSKFCITGLLNLYRYEMIQVELYLLDLVTKTFYSISHSSDPILQARLNESLADPDLKRLEEIQSRIAVLSAL